MNKKALLYALLISIFVVRGNLEYESLSTCLVPYDFLKKPRSYITFAQAPDGNQYIVKQYKYSKWQHLLATAVCDLVALDMGHRVGVSLNRACLIPVDVEFIGKELFVPATLHTVVPGIPFVDYFESDSSVYKDLNLTQKEPPLGLTRELIYQMSRHKDLPPLIALDTFVSNGGRLKHNFFYDITTDRFYGIDLASSFCHDLCGPSLENINRMLQDAELRLSPAELEGLKSYYKTFKKLVKLYPSSKITKQIDTYAKRAGFLKSSFFDKDVQKACLELFIKRKKVICMSSKYPPQLRDALKQLIRKF